jgi:hypothetical protein
MWTDRVSEKNRKYLSWAIQAVGIILILYGFIFEHELSRAIVFMATGAILGFAGTCVGSPTEEP